MSGQESKNIIVLKTNLPEGIKDNEYAEPEDMTDFAGLRVICYLRQDKEIVAGLLQDNFKVIKREDKSLDKGVDKIGYNAIHLDAMLKNDRATLPEHQRYEDLKIRNSNNNNSSAHICRNRT